MDNETSTQNEENTKQTQHINTDKFKVKGEELLGRVKELIKEGNVRRIIIKDKDYKTIVEFPVTVGLVGVLFAPVLAAIGAIAALVTECTIYVERKGSK